MISRSYGGLFHKHYMFYLFLFLFFIKIYLLITIGPAILPDSNSYINIAQMILDDPTLWRQVEWVGEYSPEKLFRPYGYPLLIAGAKLLSASNFQWVLITTQTVVSLLVLMFISWFSVRFIENKRILISLIIMAALSGFLLIDLAILTDSFYGSVFIVVFLTISAQILGYMQPHPGLSFLLGLAWVASITLRDVGLMHTFLPLSGLVLAGYCRRLGWGRTLFNAMLFLIPVAVLFFGVTYWNHVRTGHAFFSITGGINWLWPSINMLDRGLGNPFTCDDLICQVARTIDIGKGMNGVFGLAAAVENQLHLDPIDFGHLTLSHFLGTVKAHPLAFLATVFSNIQFGHFADQVFNPVSNFNELARLHSEIGQRIIPGTREMWIAVRHGSFEFVVPLLVIGLLSVMSFCCLIVAVVGPPLLFFKRFRQGDTKTIAALYLWCVVAVFIGSYALIHMEMRHALPCVPLVLMVFGFTVEAWRSGRQSPVSDQL
ncbi:hypothetical protein [Magnetospirillum molischianum]|uniref:Glycosyltransferase RgtA/B/C/D-like domain-containing protein n=1 Tax=Magnetospirillum molischianum DSM 120 TaxID=1150626 RepID=H8FT38_MAGML|nr:hypothetical protein [Magnetospirillum molischianum]CCG41526.1 membrane hypothetical protein [Magnetospirillum molischianum DSM 120]